MKTRNIIAGLSVIALMLGANFDASAQLKGLLQKAIGGAQKVGNALGQGQNNQAQKPSAPSQAANQAASASASQSAAAPA
jgi:hypothetical protein